MRIDLPEGMGDIWRSGDFTGANRPMARVTLQQARIQLTDYEYANKQQAIDSTLPGPAEAAVAVIEGYSASAGTGKTDSTLATEQTLGTIHQVYSSIVFGATAVPKELPNVKSVQWSRADGQDFATCTIQFYNTKPLPLGSTPTRDLDLPGYYTFNRGQTNFANRWGQTPNEWQNLLLPDNILRTYEGYGFNPYEIPEKDEHLLQTGLWLIDKVDYTHDGLITCSCRDIGRILGDQIIFPPVIPNAFYPLQFAGSGLQTGFMPPKTFTYSVTTGGKHDPKHPPPDNWIGPFAPPSSVRVSATGDRSATVSWKVPRPAPAQWTLRSPVGWQASSNVGDGTDPNLTFDSVDGTIWNSGVNQAVGQVFVLDFGSPLEVGGFILDPGPAGFRGLTGVFEVSMDNVTWVPVHSYGPLTGTVPQEVLFGGISGNVTPRVRYVRLRLTAAGASAWSIQNLSIEALGAPGQEDAGHDGDWRDGGPLGLPQLQADVTAGEDTIASLQGEIHTLQGELDVWTAKHTHDVNHQTHETFHSSAWYVTQAAINDDAAHMADLVALITPLQAKLLTAQQDLALKKFEVQLAIEQLTKVQLNPVLAQLQSNPSKGYRIVGYQIVLDNVRLPDIIEPEFRDLHQQVLHDTNGNEVLGEWYLDLPTDYWTHEYTYTIPENLLRNGIVYQVQVVALWQEILTPQGEIYYGTNVELTEVSDRSDPVFVRPADPTAPNVVPPGGTWPDEVLVQGQVGSSWIDLAVVPGGPEIVARWTPAQYSALRVLNRSTKERHWTVRTANVWFSDTNRDDPGNKGITVTASSGAHPEFMLDSTYYGLLRDPVTYPVTLDLTAFSVGPLVEFPSAFDVHGFVPSTPAGFGNEASVDFIQAPVGSTARLTVFNDGLPGLCALTLNYALADPDDAQLVIKVNGVQQGTSPGGANPYGFALSSTASGEVYATVTVQVNLPIGRAVIDLEVYPRFVGSPSVQHNSAAVRFSGAELLLTSADVPDVTAWDSGQNQTPAVLGTVNDSEGHPQSVVVSGDALTFALGSTATPVEGITLFCTQSGSVELNVDFNSFDTPGAVTFFYDDKGQPCTWKLIAYRDIDASGRPADQNIYSIATRPGSSAATILTGDDLGDMTRWNYLVYGMFDGTLDVSGPVPVVADLQWHYVDSSGNTPQRWRPIALSNFFSPTHKGSYPVDTPDTPQVIGRGDLFFRSNGDPGEYFAAPIGGAAPHDPGPAPSAPTVETRSSTVTVSASASKTVSNPTAGSSSTRKVTSLVKHPTALHFEDSSNTYYVGLNGAVFGHTPAMAFDASESTYWLSIGNLRNDQGYAYEWIQGKLDNVTLSSIEFSTAMKNYGVYVSVFAKGRWVQPTPHHVIPYNPQMPESHNGGNIPYVETYNCGGSEGPHSVVFADAIPGATKVRITFHNLQDFGLGQFHYRAGVRDFKAFAQSSETENVTTVKPGGHTSATITDTSSYASTSIVTTVTPAPVVAGPPQDDDAPEIARTYSVTTPPYIQPGAGTMPGMYSDYTDIVKLFCAWGGFFWPEHATQTLSDGTQRQFDFGVGEFGLENVDPVLGAEGSGRVWGDFEQTGTSGPAPITIDNWDKKTLMDGISFVRDIIGFVFYIDEGGGVVWRQPNVFAVGNWVGNYGQQSGRTSSMVTIDERQTLLSLSATVDSANVRERVFVATVDGKLGALAKGWNPNPIGLRRVAGWTDQYFMSTAECQVMADLLALRMLFTYRTDKITIPAYPCIQVDDQVRVFEQTTSEGYIHYVSGISSNNDLENGEWLYSLDTHWLGEDPLQLWVFQTGDLAPETQAYLAALQIPAGAALPEASPI